MIGFHPIPQRAAIFVVLLSLSRLLRSCTHVSATDTANRAVELIDEGYSLAKYRAAANDSNYRIIPPVFSDLTTNPEHGPPPEVQGTVGRSKKGPRKKGRIESDGEQNTSSRIYAIYSKSGREAGGVGVMPRGGGAGGTGGRGASSGASGVLDLSQGASQGAS